MSAPPVDWRRVKAVFDAAVVLDAPARSAYLADACGSDAALRQQVEALLGSHDRAEGFLETPAAALIDRGAELIGRTVGSYRIVSRLGAGGMGEVYKAHDATLDRAVVLKLLPQLAASDTDRLRRFHAEARAASSLSHPNILVIHHFGDLDGRPFMVSEFVEGETLRQRIDRGGVPVREAVWIAIQAASALAAAHARGIVHRDVKPDNLMLRPDGYVKVLDFGLAKLLEPPATASALSTIGTKPGVLMGTPHYMSPEQAEGKEIDGRADIFSLGVILYELATGVRPFTGGTPPDVLSSILRDAPKPISELNPSLPPELTAIVGRCLEKDRHRRYRSALDLRNDLDALGQSLRTRQVDARPSVAPGSANEAHRELAYYKRRLDELAGESLKLDYQISGLRKEVTQKRQAFTLLSRLQQAVGAEKDPSNIFALVLREVNGTLGMDKSVVLTPTDREHHYRPTQWTGFTEQGRSLEFERRMSETTIAFPPEFSDGTGWLLVNRKTETSPLIELLRDTFELPFFLCVPVLVERKPLGLLLSGRIKEAGSVFPPLDRGDVETFQAIAGLISASVENMRIGVLKETDRLKTEFFANISHEFRTPITLTIGPIEQLLDGRYGDVPREVREQLLIVQRSQERLLGLVNQILDLARLEAGGARLQAAHTPRINEMIDRRVDQFRPAAAGRGLEVRARLDAGVNGADLYVDREKFDRLLANLLSNALKFTRDGFIEVSTWVRDRTFWLQVADTGIGIKEDQLPFIFDRFRQADGSESREYAGTGIGLALVQEIARAHGGEVSVFSQYGKGSSFRVALPLGREHISDECVVEGDDLERTAITPVAYEGRSEPDAAERLNREAEDVFDAGRPTVLCAEDNPDLRAHIRDLLRSDYNVFVAADGHEALRLARRYSPDLLVTDQMMPNMSGRDLLRRVREDEKLRSTPVVFLTARAGTDARIESLQGGADDYLTKPFHEGELKARVANLIRNRAQEKELAALNRRLEGRVEQQLAELVRTGELKRFLPQNVVESVLAGQLGSAKPFERRRVAVLFVELSGFGEIAGALEPEDLALVAADFTREVVATAIAHGGTVTNVTAHSMMVLYEPGETGETADLAMSALRSAVRMRDNLARLDAAWRRRGISAECAIRAGINTGFCTVGVFGSEHLRCYTAVGSPVQIAAGLQSAARAGQILCAKPAFTLVEGRVRARPCEPLVLPGLPRPIEAVDVEDVTEPESSTPSDPVRVAADMSSSLVPGSRLGHYQIVKAIGKGGMGEVYRARDTRLDRAVALKLLPSDLADDVESRQRFLREAQALAALKHPNIVRIYSVEEADGRRFITMELVEGERLADVIPQGGLPLARFLELALPLVDALASAHAHGVTHRDLKPANVMLDRESGIKVLDFGLARLTRPDVLSGSTRGMVTGAGVILGTVPYMSPEQIQGKGADHRSDVFSLGIVLYEMATGRRPFQGSTSGDIMVSILRDDPESLATFRPDLPPALGRITGRCLMKNPDHRYSSAKDLYRELEILR